MRHKVINWLGVALIAAVLAATFVTFIVRQEGPGGVLLDGFGREVFETPVRLARNWVVHWRGPGWLIFDLAVLWGGFVLGVYLLSVRFRDPKN